jgi:hypothetical protein
LYSPTILLRYSHVHTEIKIKDHTTNPNLVCAKPLQILFEFDIYNTI